MAKGEGKGESAAKLANQIACIKYTIFCFNIVAWFIGAGLFAFTVWIRAEPGFAEFVDMLDINSYYIGVYILILTAVVVMVISFLGCCSALMEHITALYVFIVLQIVAFLLAIVGSAILLEHATYGSSIQPMIRNTMLRLIMYSEYPPASTTLKFIQENIGCCGADGSNDYRRLRQPLPIECRDTVTGNAFFNGCVDEMTWYLEDKSAWAAGMAMSIAMLNVINVVLSTILIQALRREEEVSYRR